jgi:quinol monooxygenase YgiN
MDTEILAIAVVRPFEDREKDVLSLLREFYAMLSRKGYCRDELYQSSKDPSRLINLRYWKSDESRREASEDPDVHRYWHRLSEMSEVEKVYEQLHEVVFSQIVTH